MGRARQSSAYFMKSETRSPKTPGAVGVRISDLGLPFGLRISAFGFPIVPTRTQAYCRLRFPSLGTIPAHTGARMRTLLMHAPSGQYFQSLEKWTSDPAAAHDFRHIAKALKFARKAGFADMELVVAFDDAVEYVKLQEHGLRLA